MLDQILYILYQLIFLVLNPIVWIPILIIYYKNKKYKEETYYKITNIGYFRVRHDTGRYGEYLTYKYLKKFEEQGSKFLFNIYVPKKEEETTEIDVLMISSKGLFVFESKNYSGWIFGSDNQKYWYQTLSSGRRRSHKEKFYNPVFQNNTHVKYLKSLIGNELPIYSIITFSDRCTLMNVNIKNSNVNVINRYQVYNLISSIYNNNPDDILSADQINEIYNKLYPYTQVDDITKQKHIDNINNNIQVNNINTTLVQDNNTIIDNIEDSNESDEIVNIEIEQVEQSEQNLSSDDKNVEIENNNAEINASSICPECGGTLLLRTARYGEHAGEKFYGCSNYPKCKYIKKIQD